MDFDKFEKDVNSSNTNIYIDYMNDVEGYYLKIKNDAYSKEVEDNIKDYGHTITSNLGKRLRQYLDDINSSPISDEDKEKARQILYKSESDFHAQGVKLQIIILNRFKISPE